MNYTRGKSCNDNHNDSIVSSFSPHAEHPGGVQHPQQRVPGVPSVQFRERVDGAGSGRPAGPDPEHIRGGRLQEPIRNGRPGLDVCLAVPAGVHLLLAAAPHKQVAPPQT